jgi:Carboxypeptidase regulatory-like domain
MRAYVFALVLVASLAMPAAPATAQVVRFGSIDGAATDESGAALPGVTVTLTSPALQVSQIAKVTGSTGEYQFVELPVGIYRVSFELAGFSRLVRENIQLTSAFSARIDAKLKVAGVEEVVAVSGQSPVIDLTNSRGGATISKDLLTAVPVSNNYPDVMNLAAGLTVTAPPPIGDIQIAGSFRNYGGTTGQERTMVDGIEMRSSDTPNFNSLDEVDVKTYGNTAEMLSGGPAVNLIIKSGGNDFHGLLTGAYINDRFESTNLDASLAAQGLLTGNRLLFFRDVSGDLGGRIIRNKLWFYGALRDEGNQATLTGLVASPGSDGIYGTADDVPAQPTITESSRMLKVSWQPTSRHKFIGLYVRHVRDANAGQGLGINYRVTPFESTLDWNYLNYQNKIEWQGTFSDHLVADVMLANSGSSSYYYSHSNNPSTFDLTTQWSTGESFNIFAENHRYDDRKQLNSGVSYFLGSHQIKAGSSLWWSSFLIDINNRSSGNYQQILNNGVPTELAVLNNPLSTIGVTHLFGGYISDTWRATKRLTVNYGVRGDRNILNAAPTVKPQGAFGNAGSFPQVDVGTWFKWGPRAGVALSLDETDKTVLKATWGLYAYYINEFFSNAFSPATQTTTTYRWHDLNGDRLYEPGEVNLSTTGPDFIGISGNASQAPNTFDLPHETEETVSLERELAPSLSARVLYVFKRNVGLTSNVNVARPYSAYSVAIQATDPGAEGILGTPGSGAPVTLYDYTPAYKGSNFVLNQYVNADGNHNDYYNSIELALSKRSIGKVSGQMSFVATKDHMWLVGVPQSPNDLVFPLNEIWERTFRMTGTYQAPYGVGLSALFLALSGVPGQRTYLFRGLPQSGTLTMKMEPYGAETGPVRTNLNLRVLKSFVMGKNRRFNVSADVLNALNSNTPWTTSYVSGPTFGQVSSIPSPGAAQFGASFAF